MKNLKQLISIALCAVAVISTAVVSVSALDSEKYDLNNDGKFDVLDVTYLQMSISGANQLTDAQKTVADYNGDGKIDVLDVTNAQMLISGGEISTQPSTQPTTAQPTTEPEPTTQPAVSAYYNREFANEVIRLVNLERAKEGLSALKKDEAITELSDIRAKEIVTLFDHQRPDGSSCFSIFGEYNVSFYSVAENLAAGQNSPDKVVQAWMNSDSHRKNIMSSKYEKIGVSCYVDKNSEYVYYWQQFFALT